MFRSPEATTDGGSPETGNAGFSTDIKYWKGILAPLLLPPIASPPPIYIYIDTTHARVRTHTRAVIRIKDQIYRDVKKFVIIVDKPKICGIFAA